MTDLEADVDEPLDVEEWEEVTTGENGESQTNGDASQEDRHVTPKASTNGLNQISADDAWQSGNHISFGDLEAAISNITITESLNDIANARTPAGPSTPQRSPAPFASSSATQPVSINVTAANESVGLTPLYNRSNSSDGLSPNGAPEGPMTPRNDAGPFVLDGSGSTGRAAGQRFRDAAAAADPVTPEHQITA